MSFRHSIRLFFFFLPFSFVSALAFFELAFAWDAVVIRIVDGDSLLVAPKNVNRPAEAAMAVRFYGIDAPELSQPGGQEAKTALQELVGPGSAIETIPVESDRYDRAVGLVLLNGKVLNLEQIRQGHAWVYGRYCRARFCRDWKEAEKEARRAMRGLWSQEEAVPPWIWRH